MLMYDPTEVYRDVFRLELALNGAFMDGTTENDSSAEREQHRKTLAIAQIQCQYYLRGEIA